MPAFKDGKPWRPTDAVPAAKPKRKPLSVAQAECRFRGADLTGAERDRLGLTHGQRWARCGHAGLPLGSLVCPCKGCGPKCDGYAAPPDEG